MKYFMDTEFYEYQPYHRVFGNEWHRADGANAIQLISIGIVAEDGREFYAENADFNWDVVPEDHWLQDNVRPHLFGEPQPLERASDIVQPWRQFRRYAAKEGGHWHAADIADAIKNFVYPANEGGRQFYGWYCDYDWVVFCGLFGRMVDLPDGFPMYMRDLKQVADMIGNPSLSMRVRVEGPEHHALTDARDVRAKYLMLKDRFDNLIQP